MASRAQLEPHYERLGVSSTATEAEIAAAYRRLALEHHPDRSYNCTRTRATAEAQFKRIGESYAALLGDLRNRHPRSGRGKMRTPRYMGGAGTGRMTAMVLGPAVIAFAAGCWVMAKEMRSAHSGQPQNRMQRTFVHRDIEKYWRPYEQETRKAMLQRVEKSQR